MKSKSLFFITWWIYGLRFFHVYFCYFIWTFLGCCFAWSVIFTFFFFFFFFFFFKFESRFILMYPFRIAAIEANRYVSGTWGTNTFPDDFSKKISSQLRTSKSLFVGNISCCFGLYKIVGNFCPEILRFSINSTVVYLGGWWETGLMGEQPS